jgi:hypothetical protein
MGAPRSVGIGDSLQSVAFRRDDNCHRKQGAGSQTSSGRSRQDRMSSSLRVAGGWQVRDGKSTIVESLSMAGDNRQCSNWTVRLSLIE